MKIKFKYYFSGIDATVCAAYYKANKWRIYNNGSHYYVRTEKQSASLIQEVAEEMHVRKENIKLVKPDYIIFQDVKD